MATATPVTASARQLLQRHIQRHWRSSASSIDRHGATCLFQVVVAGVAVTLRLALPSRLSSRHPNSVQLAGCAVVEPSFAFVHRANIYDGRRCTLSNGWDRWNGSGSFWRQSLPNQQHGHHHNLTISGYSFFHHRHHLRHLFFLFHFSLFFPYILSIWSIKPGAVPTLWAEMAAIAALRCQRRQQRQCVITDHWPLTDSSYPLLPLTPAAPPDLRSLSVNKMILLEGKNIVILPAPLTQPQDAAHATSNCHTGAGKQYFTFELTNNSHRQQADGNEDGLCAFTERPLRAVAPCCCMIPIW